METTVFVSGTRAKELELGVVAEFTDSEFNIYKGEVVNMEWEPGNTKVKIDLWNVEKTNIVEIGLKGLDATRTERNRVIAILNWLMENATQSRECRENAGDSINTQKWQTVESKLRLAIHHVNANTLPHELPK